MAGLHRSPYHGFSVEFTDYREYAPGDDLRYLDWKLLARRDRSYIKRFEDETNLRCYLLVDFSKSMGFGTLDYQKSEYARTLAATLSWFLNRQKDAVGLTTFAESILDIVPPRFRPGHFRRLLVTLEKAVSGESTDIAAPLEQIARTVSKRGMIVLISDLLAPPEQIEQNLGFLRSRGHEVVILRTLDPAEIDFQFDGASMFHDLETGRELYVDPAEIGRDYRRRFEEHELAIKTTCSNLGIDYFRVSTDQPLSDALFYFLQSRAQLAQAESFRRSRSERCGGPRSGGTSQ